MNNFSKKMIFTPPRNSRTVSFLIQFFYLKKTHLNFLKKACVGMSFTSFFDFRALKKMGVEPRRNSHPKTPEKNAKNRRKFWCKTSDLSAFIFLIKIWKTPETRYRPGVAAKCRSLHILRTFCKTGPRDFVILDTFFSKNCM